jgi:hypothetical protein
MVSAVEQCQGLLAGCTGWVALEAKTLSSRESGVEANDKTIEMKGPEFLNCLTG